MTAIITMPPLLGNAKLSRITIVAWLIAHIKRRRSGKRHFGGGRLTDATLSDLGITREQAEFGN
jgi:uncharacterized protein YjiS (DUF1127 family)